MRAVLSDFTPYLFNFIFNTSVVIVIYELPTISRPSGFITIFLYRVVYDYCVELSGLPPPPA